MVITDHIGSIDWVHVSDPHARPPTCTTVWQTAPDVHWQPTKANCARVTLGSLGISDPLLNQPRQTQLDAITAIHLYTLRMQVYIRWYHL